MIRTMALIFGIVFLLIGIGGFIPSLVQPALEHHDVGMNHGLLLGIFPVNTPHNIVHIVFGLWGLAAYRSFAGARSYFQAVAVVYALLTVMGLLPQTNTTFGLVPIYGNDVWLHLVLAAVAAYLGFIHRERLGDVR